MTRCITVDGHCPRCETALPFAFSMAFQPIVDVRQARPIAHEALVRGRHGESAQSILSQVTPGLLYRFDQACRIRAIELASQLGMTTDLSINFLPEAVYEPNACIQATLEVSRQVGWPTERLIFEIVESERVRDRPHLRHIIDTYRRMGFTTALDDFGSGYANLDLLTELCPGRLKIDRALVMGCDHDPRRQAILASLVALGERLDILLIAEGVETGEEARWLARHGLPVQQGFFHARPIFEGIADDTLNERLTALQRSL